MKNLMLIEEKETRNKNAIADTLDMEFVDCARPNVSPQRPSSLGMDIARPSSLVMDIAKDEAILRDTTNSNEKVSKQPGPRKNKKRRRAAENALKTFRELYVPTGENLGEGSTGSVMTYKNILTHKEYAVKVIDKSGKFRHKVLKEVEIFHHCKGNPHILQLVEYFEEDDRFYLIFNKMEGGTLLQSIQSRGHLTEQEASLVVRDIATALDFLHNKGIAHRDLKPENVLCEKRGQVLPLKICDFDLGSGIILNSREATPVTTPELQTPVGSVEFMAPEVVDVWQDQAWSYDKKCDLWSLGIICYIMLCGYPPFYSQCGGDCGWERGEACQNCQELLFTRIQDGTYDFPEDEWDSISESAKDLIRHLLVRDPHLRYSATEVLRHPWVAMESPMAPLNTPRILLRNNSIKELDAFAETAIAVNRMILRHISISEAFQTPRFRIGNDSDGESGSESEETPPDASGTGAINFNQNNSVVLAKVSPDQPPVLWMGLSPPGGSTLAQRRRYRNSSSDSEKEYSPPKYPSAMF